MALIVRRISVERTEMFRTNIPQRISDRHFGAALLKRALELINSMMLEQYYEQLEVELYNYKNLES